VKGDTGSSPIGLSWDGQTLLLCAWLQTMGMDETDGIIERMVIALWKLQSIRYSGMM
jgi:hypothetical protein